MFSVCTVSWPTSTPVPVSARVSSDVPPVEESQPATQMSTDPNNKIFSIHICRDRIISSKFNAHGTLQRASQHAPKQQAGRLATHGGILSAVYPRRDKEISISKPPSGAQTLDTRPLPGQDHQTPNPIPTLSLRTLTHRHNFRLPHRPAMLSPQAHQPSAREPHPPHPPHP